MDDPRTPPLDLRVGPLDRLFQRRLDGPQLDLPLTDILWTIYVMPNRFYYGFGGTLECRA